MRERISQSILRKKYVRLCQTIGIKEDCGYNNLNFHVKEVLRDFMKCHKRVAIYCYGIHTQMLMADFVADLRDVICIIDNGKDKKSSDFLIIKDSEIEGYNLDGIIISSYIHKEDIKRGLSKNHKHIDVLDIYEELEKKDIYLEKEFYSEGPYQIYTRINTLQLQYQNCKSNDLLRQIMEEYVYIKDFRLAIDMARVIYEKTSDNHDKEILDSIKDLYETEKKILQQSSKDNILILCLDGMRRIDFFDEKLFGKTFQVLKDEAHIYKNAYSYSTMTYESLVPAFTENTNQKTKYYLKEEAKSEECRFIKKAMAENKPIFVYGDGNHYVYDKRIKYTGCSQTITEKIWDFIVDIERIEGGIFYLHELYESHYSFANPYTKEKLISNGSAMLFDFLPQNKGKLRTNYKKQEEDALRYVDDTLSPFIEILPCKLVLFSDHGNLILDSETELKDIREEQLHAAEDWIRIPLLIKSNLGKRGESNEIISLMEINNILISIMEEKEFTYKPKDYIKIGRSEIYNQQFKELYRIMACEYDGEAFEGFIFKEGYKLLIFSNGVKKLYKSKDDTLICDDEKIDQLFELVRGEVSILP